MLSTVDNRSREALFLFIFLFSIHHIFEDNLSWHCPNIRRSAAPWECTYLCVWWGLSGWSDSSGLKQSYDVTELSEIWDVFLFLSITVISVQWLSAPSASSKSETMPVHFHWGKINSSQLYELTLEKVECDIKYVPCLKDFWLKSTCLFIIFCNATKGSPWL